MTAHSAGDLEVESCPRCAGLWLRHPTLIAFKSVRRLVHSFPGLVEALRSRAGGAEPMGMGDEPAGTECPVCGNVLVERRIEDDSPTRGCVSCGGVWLDSESVARLVWTGGARAAASAPRDAGEGRFDRFTFHDPWTLLLALPLATVAAWVINSTFMVGFLRPFHIWIHEFGHASVAWFSGRRALPLPIGWTSWQPDRSVVVYFALLFLIGVLFFTAWRERLRGAMMLAGVLATVQFVMTWAFPQESVELWITFGGIGGEFAISTFLLVLFYFRLPDRLRWDFWRYPVLVIGASTFWENTAFWSRVERGQESIPWGSILGAGDAGGDMDRLVLDYDWGASRIITAYNGLGSVCIALLVLVFIGFLIVNRDAVSRALRSRRDQGPSGLNVGPKSV